MNEYLRLEIRPMKVSRGGRVVKEMDTYRMFVKERERESAMYMGRLRGGWRSRKRPKRGAIKEQAVLDERRKLHSCPFKLFFFTS